MCGVFHLARDNFACIIKIFTEEDTALTSPPSPQSHPLDISRRVIGSSRDRCQKHTPWAPHRNS